MNWIAIILYLLGATWGVHDLSRDGEFVGVPTVSIIFLAMLWPVIVAWTLYTRMRVIIRTWFDIGG